MPQLGGINILPDLPGGQIGSSVDPFARDMGRVTEDQNRMTTLGPVRFSNGTGERLTPPGEVTGGTPGVLDPNSLEGIDAEIAQLQGQIGTAQEGGGAAGPDYSGFFKSPGYDFRFDEGVRAIDRSASARGQLMSGGQMRELQRYGQGLASSEFGNYANRLSALAGIGQTATTAGGQLGAAAAGQVGQSAANMGQSIMAGGTAAASGIVGSSNAFQQGLGGALGQFGGAVQQWGGGPNWGAINQQAFSDVNNPAFADIF